MESFHSVIFAAVANQKRAETQNAKFFSTKVSQAKKIEKHEKGKIAPGVKAFLEKQQKEEQLKDALERKKKENLLKIRKESNNAKKANAMAKTTKDNRKTFTEDELKRARAEAQERALRVAEALKNGKRAPQRMVGLKHTKSAQASKTDEFIDDDTSSDEEKDNFQVIKEAKEKTLYKGSEKNPYLEKERMKKKLKAKKQREKERSVNSHTEHKKKHKDHHSDRHREKHKSHRKDKEKREKLKRREEFKKKLEENKKNEASQEKKKQEEEPVRPKIKPRFNKPMPPPLSFEKLLSLAAESQSAMTSALNGSKTLIKTEPPKKNKNIRPMTAEEKESYQRRQSKEYQHWLKFGGPKPEFKKSSDNDSDSSDKSDEYSGHQPSKNGLKTGLPGVKSDNNSISKNHKLLNDSTKSTDSIKSQPRPPPNVPRNGYTINPKSLMNVEEARKQKALASVPRTVSSTTVSNYDKNNQPKPTKPEPQLSTWDRLYSQHHKPKAPKRPRVESESEYDSYEEDEYDDLDDFIDDGDAGVDISSEIKNIFGYDKSKYKNERLDDINDMETTFSRQIAEEKYSAKVGMKEDLEDMKMEEEHKKRKMQLKKLAAKRRR